MTVELLRAATRAVVPWKNGGGVTREVAVHPAGSGFETLDWRVSIAEVRAAGPFSPLPGLERRLAVLEGTLAIAIGGHPEVQLSPETAAVHFAGDARVDAHPVGGPVTDLNVMTRRGKFTADLRLHRAQHPTSLAKSPTSLLVVALSDFALKARTAEWRLSRLDAVRIENESGCEIHPRGAPVRFYVIRLQPLST
jgi:hypothetical protein